MPNALSGLNWPADAQVEPGQPLEAKAAYHLERLNDWLSRDSCTDAEWLSLGMILGDIESFLWDLSHQQTPPAGRRP